MTPKIDEELCTGCGNCEEVCPDVFELGDDDIAHVIGPCNDEDCCREAAEECPVEAIILEED